MSERKNIERFFQEKFKNFEAAPPEHLWQNIDQSLSKKSNKSKVIPLWWKVAGAAALLAGLLLTGNLVFNPSNSTNIQEITDTKGTDSTATTPVPKQPVVTRPETETPLHKSKTDPASSKKTNSGIISTPTTVVEQAVAKDSKQKNQNQSENPVHGNNPTQNKNEGIAQVAQNRLNDQDSADNNRTEKMPSNAIADNTKVNEDDNEILMSDEEVLAHGALNETDTLQKDPKKRSLLEVVEEMEQSKNEALAANDQDEKSLRWSVQPNVAPVYYNTLSQGSPISQQLSGNAKEGDVSISFGVNIAYQISKRFSIRSGLNSVNMGYATDGIEFGPAISSTSQHQLNVRFNRPSTSSSPNIALSDGKTPLYTPDSELQARSENSYQGSINQKFGYLEVPMELKYRLVDTKIGVNIIGGFSSLFLTDNKVIINSTNNLKSEVGEASNLNDMSFSTNIGVGLDYQFSKKLLFNLEPMFKYQMGTFSSDDGGFSPYMLGVYTGLSFSF